MSHYLQLFYTDYIIFLLFNLLLSSIIILLERKNPTATLAWLFFMAMLPGIGFLIYIILSQNLAKRKLFKYTLEETELYNNVLGSQLTSLETGRFDFVEKDNAKFSGHIQFHCRLSGAFFSQNNHVEIFTDGNKKFDSLFRDIACAKHHIHLLYFIIKDDDLSHKLFHLLCEKAREGVMVRLLIDHVGGRHLRKKSLESLRQSGVEIAFFFPSKLKYFNLKANYRNHRKIAVIDGESGYLGGFNIGDEYLGLHSKFGNWRDTHLKIQGDAVVSLQLRFFLDWRTASRQSISATADYITTGRSFGKTGMQIVSSGPDNYNEQIKQGFIKMILSAKKYIYLQSPYFIPDDSILEALRIAAASGVDVRIMLPDKPDHIFVHWASYSYLGSLLEYGVKAYLYRNGFLHAKSIVIDDQMASVGTCNFDIRSFKLNFEVNAFIYNKLTSLEMKRIFLQDTNYCEDITMEKWEDRSLLFKTRESISRLFSPLL